MNALSAEFWSKNTSHILGLRHERSINWTMKQKHISHRRSPSGMLYQLNYDAKVRLTPSLSVMNALSTELWSKNTSHILALCFECSINWTMKQKYVSHPHSPSWMLYQVNYEGNCTFDIAALALFFTLHTPSVSACSTMVVIFIFSPSSSQEVDQRTILTLGIAWAGVTNPWGLLNFPTHNKPIKNFSPVNVTELWRSNGARLCLMWKNTIANLSHI